MSSVVELKNKIKTNLNSVKSHLNAYLRGEGVEEIRVILKRLGRGGKLPHWYSLLEQGKSMPNLDGKTIGSVIEMTLVAVLEKKTLKELNCPELFINPAKGVDIPPLELGVKSPSENFCTSEPFFSSYERVLGNYHDNLILLTDYQTAKKRPPPVRIQIKDIKYLEGSEVADKNLCAIARKHRGYLLEKNETHCKKLLQFLCHINQQDWRAKSLLQLCDNLQESDEDISMLVNKINTDFENKVKKSLKDGSNPIEQVEMDKILEIKGSLDKPAAIVNACNDWVVDNHKEFGRMPSDNEWQRFIASPLNGKIGLSYALQWRYNFGSIFRN